ncbi:hypothetical protein ACWKX9_22025 [Enterobacter asburiae]
MIDKRKNEVKMVVAILIGLFLSCGVAHDYQQKKKEIRQFEQVNNALNRLNTTLEQGNALQARQVSLNEQTVGLLIDTRNAAMTLSVRVATQDNASK